MDMLKLVFTVPKDQVEQVKEALFAQGAGKLGHYEKCAWQVLGTGQFCPGPGSKPAIGQHGQVETVAEYRVEVLCARALKDKVRDALLRTHPYEEPAYEFIAIEV